LGVPSRFTAVAALVVLGLAAAIAALILLGEPRALAVVESVPANGATDVARTAQLTVTFSRPVDEASVRAGLAVTPATEGFVSAVGRRAAFTPRWGLRGDTVYTLVLGPEVRDRGGRPLAGEVRLRFRTRPLGLVLRAPEGRLVRATLGGEVRPLADAPVGAFAVGGQGELAHVRPGERTLVIERPGAGSAAHVALPPGLEVEELAWAPGGRSVLLLGAEGRPGGSPTAALHLVRLDAAPPRLAPLGPRPGPIDPGSALVTEALIKSLVEIVYSRESFALTPDGRAVIARDRNWDFAVLGLDGQRRGRLGPYLAVGNASPRGDALAVVDVDPADPALRRQVLAYRSDGTTRALSPPARDSHAPRFAHQTDRVVFATAEPAGPPRERRFWLEVVDVATGVRERLTTPPAGQSDDAPRWAPDDTWISFRRLPPGAPEQARVWVVPLDGGAARPLPVAATDARWIP
jgi:hypothetical protein